MPTLRIRNASQRPGSISHRLADVVSTSLSADLDTRELQFPGLFAWAIFRIVFLSFVTIGLLWRTVQTIDQRVVQPRTHDLLVESGSAINQRAPRSRALVRKVP
jgi:hypothetical protein